MSTQTFVIVGASLAGAKAAEELRVRGFDGRVLLIGSEAERPYERPPLTKAYLRGTSEREASYVHPAGSAPSTTWTSSRPRRSPGSIRARLA
jgi:3-phenylpropionate/trans-cinnamate dioxygenase ferredoxin reductase subunit